MLFRCMQWGRPCGAWRCIGLPDVLLSMVGARDPCVRGWRPWQLLFGRRRCIPSQKQRLSCLGSTLAEDGFDPGCTPCSSAFSLGRQYGSLSPQQDSGRSLRDPSSVARACDQIPATSSMQLRSDELRADVGASAPTPSHGEVGASSVDGLAQAEHLTPSAPCVGPSRDGAAD
jgi:hypothetical protein